MRTSWLWVLPILAGFASGARLEAEDAVPASTGRWMLNLEHGRLRVVNWSDAAGRTTAYHYMTLKVTNKTPYAREWRPNIRVVLDTKPDQPTHAMPLVEALDAIRRQERDPALVTVNETAGKIAPDTTISCVAIFGRLDPMYHRANVQLRGLASNVVIYKVEKYPGSRTVIVDSAYHARNQAILDELRKEAKAKANGYVEAPESEYQEFLEDRFWDVAYSRQGDEFRAEDSVIRFESEGWKIAGEPKLLRVIGEKPKDESSGG